MTSHAVIFITYNLSFVNLYICLFIVEKEDYATVEQYLKSWVRCAVRRNSKSMRELCDGTGNTRVKALLYKYEWVSLKILVTRFRIFVNWSRRNHNIYTKVSNRW